MNSSLRYLYKSLMIWTILIISLSEVHAQSPYDPTLADAAGSTLQQIGNAIQEGREIKMMITQQVTNARTNYWNAYHNGTLNDQITEEFVRPYFKRICLF